MPFLHLPVQSGSDRVLAAMNRGHTAADFLRVVERLRAARLIDDAGSAVLWVGGGAVQSGAAEQVDALARRLRAPSANSPARIRANRSRFSSTLRSR